MLTERLLAVATGGAEWVLWLLLGLSVASIGVMLERFVWFQRRRTDVSALGGRLLQLIRAGEREAAARLLEEDPSEAAHIARRCLDWLDAGPEAVNEILSATTVERKKRVAVGTVFLGTLGNNAPFLGLFGTVLGVIDAFRELGANTMGSIGTVMTGIGEALVATAVGILVALPAVVAYNMLSRRAAAVEDDAGALVNLMIAANRTRS